MKYVIKEIELSKCVQLKNGVNAGDDIETNCPYCQTHFVSPDDLIQPQRVVRQVLSRFQMECRHDGCGEQIGYDQYDAHTDQCQFKRVVCEHCNQEYQKIGKDDHEANCLDLIKFKNLELSAKLEEAIAEVADVRSDLQSTTSELENVKRTCSEEREKSFAELTKVHSELDLVKTQLKNVERSISVKREKWEAQVAEAHLELESTKSQIQNTTVLSGGFKYFENIFMTKVNQAKTRFFDVKGHNDNYDYFQSRSGKQKFAGAKLSVAHENRVYSDKKGDWIFLCIKMDETTKTIEAEWNTMVWQNGKKISDEDLKHTFEKCGGRGHEFKKICNESEFFVIVTTNKWEVTNK